MLKTFATMFSGGGGADLGLLAAGLRPVWAVERDPRIAAVYADNFGHWPIVADVCAVDYAALPRCDWLHASPECTRASKANRHAGESEIDLAVGEAVQRALVAMRPQVFSLENVWEYRRFAAFQGICGELERLGYVYDFHHVNAADHGVPQTRKRLILRAARQLLPPFPPALPWVGWYEAIEDLLPELPESQLAPWQLARLPAVLERSVLVGGGNTQLDQVDSRARAWELPAFTVTAGEAVTRNNRALLVDGDNANRFSGVATTRGDEEPCFTLRSGRWPPHRAVLLDQVNDRHGRPSTIREGVDPCWTVPAYSAKHPAPRAVLWSGNRSHDQVGREYGPVLRRGDQPAVTCTAHSGPDRAQLQQRVVAMTPRALARFQTFPDSYRLPAGRELAALIVGNAVPPRLMWRLARGIIESFDRGSIEVER